MKNYQNILFTVVLVSHNNYNKDEDKKHKKFKNIPETPETCLGVTKPEDAAQLSIKDIFKSYTELKRSNDSESTLTSTNLMLYVDMCINTQDAHKNCNRIHIRHPQFDPSTQAM